MRQSYCKFRALSKLAFNLDCSSHKVNNSFYNGKSQSCTRDFAFGGIMLPDKRIKNVRDILVAHFFLGVFGVGWLIFILANIVKSAYKNAL